MNILICLIIVDLIIKFDIEWIHPLGISDKYKQSNYHKPLSPSQPPTTP